MRHAVREYLSAGRELSVKVSASLLGLCDQAVDTMHWEALAYFHAMLDKHLDLVERRLLQAETIPPLRKCSRFSSRTPNGFKKANNGPTSNWAAAVDRRRPAQLVQDYDVPVGVVDVDQSVPVTDRLLGRYGVGQIASLSFDKGFTRPRTGTC